MAGFIFGGNTGETPQSLARKRALAERLLGRSRGRTPRNVGEGLNALGNALSARFLRNHVDRQEALGRQYDDNAFRGEVASAVGGGGPSMAAAAPAPAQWDGQDVRSGIAATAQSLGVDPLDLATAISYETGGSFDPAQPGPTTQWGQHKGLIQFGEPQARQYGVDWNDPVGSQLGSDGAVARYLKDNGVQPGMGLPEIYSAINAGGVGETYLNRSDAHNGGAPGTVRDKVNNQMDGHRQRASAMFADGAAPVEVASLNPQQQMVNAVPAPEPARPVPGAIDFTQRQDPRQVAQRLLGVESGQPQGQPDTQVAQLVDGFGTPAGGQNFPAAPGSTESLMNTLDRPWLAPGQQRVLQMMLQQRLQQQDPMRQLDLQIRREQLNQMRNPQQEMPASVIALRERARMAGLQPGSQEYADFMKSGGREPLVNVNTGDQNPMPGLGKLDGDFSYLYNPDGTVKLDANGQPVIAPIPGSNTQIERQQAERERQTQVQQQKVAFTQYEQKFNFVNDSINSVIEDVGGWTAGPAGTFLSSIPGTPARDMRSTIETIKANLGFDELQAMREASPTGGALGQVTERELAFLQAVQGNLDQAQSPQQLREVLTDLKARRVEFQAARRRAYEIDFGTPMPDGGAGEMSPQQGGMAAPQSQTEYEALPSGTRFQAPDGTMRVKP